MDQLTQLKADITDGVIALDENSHVIFLSAHPDEENEKLIASGKIPVLIALILGLVSNFSEEDKEHFKNIMNEHL